MFASKREAEKKKNDASNLLLYPHGEPRPCKPPEEQRSH